MFRLKHYVVAVSAILCFLGLYKYRQLIAFEQYTLTTDTLSRIYLLHVPVSKSSEKLPCIVFLHGLAENTQVIEKLWFAPLVEKSDEHGFILVAPIGVMGAYDKRPEFLAWSLDNKNDIQYLNQLVVSLKEKYAMDEDRIILAGFSNGAFFASQVAQQNLDNNLFSGFWLQGGGFSEKMSNLIVPRKIVIEIGALDEWHLPGVNQLKCHLEKNGWKLGKNLMFYEHQEGHVLYLDNFGNVFDFLFR